MIVYELQRPIGNHWKFFAWHNNELYAGDSLRKLELLDSKYTQLDLSGISPTKYSEYINDGVHESELSIEEILRLKYPDELL